MDTDRRQSDYYLSLALCKFRDMKFTSGSSHFMNNRDKKANSFVSITSREPDSTFAQFMNRYHFLAH
jgi:hypothetical protein